MPYPFNLPTHLGIFKQEEPQEETRGVAAMALKFLVNMKEKVTCAICLELLTEPLSLHCGHSFCQACVTDNKESEIGPGGESSCPVCGVKYSFGNLWFNQHLANIVERVKEVKLSPEEGQTNDLCSSHGERLQLFCKEDRKAICQLCEWSREHCGHQIVLMEEVIKECQVRPRMEGDEVKDSTPVGNLTLPSYFTHHSILILTPAISFHVSLTLSWLPKPEGHHCVFLPFI